MVTYKVLEGVYMFRLRALTVAVLFLAQPAVVGAGIAPPEPGVIDKSQFRDGEDIFRIRFPNKPYDGPLATCSVCGKPLKDHLDPDFVCRSPNAPAEPINERQTRCPVCGLEFKALTYEARRTGSIDSDFCRHPKGRRALVLDIWMCPKCGYAAQQGEFERPVDEAIKAFVANVITPGTKLQLSKLIRLRPKTFRFEDFSFLDQPSIPDFIKYENAVAIHREAKADPWKLAGVQLGASHVYRRLLNGAFTAEGLDAAIRRVDVLLLEELSGDEPLERVQFIRRLLDQGKDSSTRKLTLRERFYLLMRLAGLYDRLGEPWLAKKCFSDAEELCSQEKDERVKQALLGLVREHKGHLEREVYHQVGAAASLKVALELGCVPDGEQLTAVYLLGELLARTGEIARAIPWLELAVKLAGSEAGEKSRIASWARARLGSPAFYTEGGQKVPADQEESSLIAKLFPSLIAQPKEQPVQQRAEVARPAERPASCEGLMKLVWRAISAYRDARGGEFPPNLKALADAGLLDPALAKELKCPETGKAIYYRRPPAGSGRTFILYHADPKESPCRNILYSDGTIGRFGE